MNSLKGICILLLLFVSACSGYSTNQYCYPNLCTNSQYEKIACGNYQQIQCSGGKIVSMTEELKDLILTEHNTLRNKIASGQQRGFHKAERMATMTWDNELAYLAELNVNRCIFQHDCHNFPKYPYSGQNIGIKWMTKAPYDSTKEFIKYFINNWYNEYSNANAKDIERYIPRSLNEPEIGHFTAMVQDRNYKVGCAYIKYPDMVKGRKMDAYLFVCNYSYTNIKKGKVYIETFNTAGSGCLTGTNPKFPSLCSVNENYVVQ